MKLRQMGLKHSLALFIPAAVLILLQTKFTIPYLATATGQEPIIFWFIIGGLGIFLPLLIAATITLRSEGYKISLHTFMYRMRFRSITKSDIKWSLIGMICAGGSSWIVMKGLEMIVESMEHQPVFMQMEVLSPGRYWLLLLWLPYWVLNIMGEEILWRGVMLPRQELVWGRRAWLYNGIGWAMFHIAFGWKLLLTLIPMLLIQTYMVQKTKNSWTGVIIHAGINGPAFLAISFGVL